MGAQGRSSARSQRPLGETGRVPAAPDSDAAGGSGSGGVRAWGMGVGYRNEVGGFLCGWSLRKPPKCWGPGEEGEEVNSAPGTRPTEAGGRKLAGVSSPPPRPEPREPASGAAPGRRSRRHRMWGRGGGRSGPEQAPQGGWGRGDGEASGSPGLPVRAAAGGCGRVVPAGLKDPRSDSPG